MPLSNFSPLLLTQGDALIMPPLIARSGASMRIEDSMTATAATSTYELLEPALYRLLRRTGANF